MRLRLTAGRVLDNLLIVALIVLLALGILEHYASSRRSDRLTTQTKLLAMQGAEAHRAICIFRGDLQQRVNSTRAFLRDHPQGFAGLPANTIRVSLNNQQQAVKSLSVLHCL